MKAILSEFERMQLIGEEFPIALVAPFVLAKVDAVAIAVERAVLARLAQAQPADPTGGGL